MLWLHHLHIIDRHQIILVWMRIPRLPQRKKAAPKDERMGLDEKVPRSVVDQKRGSTTVETTS